MFQKKNNNKIKATSLPFYHTNIGNKVVFQLISRIQLFINVGTWTLICSLSQQTIYTLIHKMNVMQKNQLFTLRFEIEFVLRGDKH